MAADERETGNLIGSDKVEGTAVYGPDDQEIGSIERVMIDKLSGRVSYAVLSFGGFLGHRRRPLSIAVAVTEIRHRSRRIPDRHHVGPAQGRTEIRQ